MSTLQKTCETTERVCNLALLKSPAEITFYQEYHDLAVREGEWEAGRHDKAGVAALARGVVYSAATEGLAKVARMVGQQGFDSRRAGGRVTVFVRYEVKTALHRECGWRGQRCESHLLIDGRGPAFGYAGNEPDPAEVAEQADEPVGRDPDKVIESIRTLTGGVIPNKFSEWRDTAIRLGLSRSDAYRSSRFTLQSEVVSRLQAFLSVHEEESTLSSSIERRHGRKLLPCG